MKYFCFNKNSEINYVNVGKASVKNYTHVWRTLDECELFIVTEGELFLRQDDREFHLKKDEWLITERNKAYGGYKPSTCSFHWLHFNYNDATACFSETRIKEFSVAQTGHLQRQDALLIIAILIEQYGWYKEKKAVTDSLILALLQDMCSLTIDVTKRAKKDKRFQPIMDYFSQNPYYSEVWDVRSMAEFFGYSEKYLIRVFKRNTGQTPLQFLNTHKIQRAQWLLADSDMTIKAIASTLHFDYYYFMKLFRRMTGMSPTEYRKKVIPDWQKYVLPDKE